MNTQPVHRTIVPCRQPSFEVTDEQIAKFWSYVTVKGPDECWEWKPTCRNHFGYGLWYYQKDGKQRSVTSNRVSWCFSVGRIPDDLWVLHKCDNPPCCNPAHLFLGTATDNSNDRVKKGRTSSGEKQSKIMRDYYREHPEKLICSPYRLSRAVRGERFWSAKLTSEKVLEIRSKYVPYKYGLKRLGKEYGITHKSVHSIIAGRSWKHVKNQKVSELSTELQ